MSDSDDKQKPDIVHLTADSLKTDFIDCKSNSTKTENMFDFKRDSVYFERGYSHASYTPAAMSAVMTGKYPCEIEMTSVETGKISDETKTFGRDVS